MWPLQLTGAFIGPLVGSSRVLRWSFSPSSFSLCTLASIVSGPTEIEVSGILRSHPSPSWDRFRSLSALAARPGPRAHACPKVIATRKNCHGQLPAPAGTYRSDPSIPSQLLSLIINATRIPETQTAPAYAWRNCCIGRSIRCLHPCDEIDQSVDHHRCRRAHSLGE